VTRQAPSIGRVLAMVGFALSCIGILLFLWLSFGGSVPLKPKGYRFTAEFPEATQLTQGANVRISGVDVGKVVKKEPDLASGLTAATIEMQPQFAPVPRNTRAILRQKTLLGETYVELTPGQRTSGMLADGGTLPQGQVAPSVQLDEIFRTFNPETRRALQTWLQEQGRALDRSGRPLNEAIASLDPFAEHADDVLRILRRHSRSTRALVRDTGVVFAALSERRGQLRELVSNSNRVFETTARRNRELAGAVVALPTFLRETRTTTRRLTRFAHDTNPLVTQLRPAAVQLAPTLTGLRAIAPHLQGVFDDLEPLIRVSRRGLPALDGVLAETRPLLARLDPYLRRLNPILDYLGPYKREIAAFFALDAASTQATAVPVGTSTPLHYLRTTNPVNPEVLSAYPSRIASNRTNPYTEPGAYGSLRGGLPAFGSYVCPPAGSDPPLSAALTTLLNTTDPGFAEDIVQFVFGGDPSAVPAPPCTPQRPLGRLVGQTGVYPQLRPIP
jgi:phospholipid/cholesterol/gamma-HCH transport system substrate-binding protein